MGATSGLVLFGLGLALIAGAVPRRGEDTRPFLRSAFAQALYPSVCLALLAMGAAFVVTDLLRAN